MTSVKKNQRPRAGGDGISARYAQSLFNDGYRAERLYNPPLPLSHLSDCEKEIWWDGVEAARSEAPPKQPSYNGITNSDHTWASIGYHAPHQGGSDE